MSKTLASCLSYPDPWLVKKPAFDARAPRRYGYTARDNSHLHHSAISPTDLAAWQLSLLEATKVHVQLRWDGWLDGYLRSTYSGLHSGTRFTVCE